MPQTKETDNLLSVLQQDMETLLQNTASIMLVFAPGGKVLAANTAAARIMGYTTVQLVGKNLFKIFKFAATPLETHTLQAGESQPFRETYQGRTISGILVPILDAQGSLVRIALLAEDHTDRLRAEEQLRSLTLEKENAVRQAALLRVLAVHAYDHRRLLQHVADGIARQVGDTCIIGIFSEDDAELQVGSISHRSQAALKEIRAALKRKAYPLQHVSLGGLILQKKSYVGEHLTREQAADLTPPDLWPVMDRVTLQGLAAIPLLAGELVLGGIFVTRDRPRSQPFSPADISLLQTIAGPLALCLENAGRFEEIQDNREKLRGLLQKLLKSQEDQFQRLGRELHDHIGQDLTAININVSLIERMLPENYPDDLRARLTSANQLVEGAVAHMRSLMADFVPPMLDRYGLTAALLWYGQKITKRTNMPVHIDDGNLHDTRLPQQVEIALFRIAQEALNNTANHTQASEAEIELRDEAGSILMIVADNGAGFDPQASPLGGDKRLGLEMMRERARAIGASFDIKSTIGAGTKVIVRIPGNP